MYRLSLGPRPSAKQMPYEWRALRDRFGHLLPSQVNEGIVLAHIKARRAEVRKGKLIKDGTIYTELSRLRCVFSYGVQRKLCEPVHVPRPQKSAPRTDYITRSSMPNLLNCCTMPHIKLFAVLAWTTGGRMTAILELTWDRVDFDKGIIALPKPAQAGLRMKQRAVVPMNATARAALLAAREGATSDHVIEWASQPVKSVKKGLGAAAKRAGMPWITPHVFRHSAAVAMAEAGVPMAEIAQFLGHADSRITEQVYARFSPTYLRNAATSLDL